MKQPAVYILAPVALIMIILFMDELLAPRAAGGFVLLIANPLLKAAMWHDSPMRIVVTVLVYIWIVYAMIIILSPHRFRLTAAYWVENDERLRLGGGMSLAAGVALVTLGVTVY